MKIAVFATPHRQYPLPAIGDVSYRLSAMFEALIHSAIKTTGDRRCFNRRSAMFHTGDRRCGLPAIGDATARETQAEQGIQKA